VVRLTLTAHLALTERVFGAPSTQKLFFLPLVIWYPLLLVLSFVLGERVKCDGKEA